MKEEATYYIPQSKKVILSDFWWVLICGAAFLVYLETQGILTAINVFLIWYVIWTLAKEMYIIKK